MTRKTSQICNCYVPLLSFKDLVQPLGVQQLRDLPIEVAHVHFTSTRDKRLRKHICAVYKHQEQSRERTDRYVPLLPFHNLVQSLSAQQFHDLPFLMRLHPSKHRHVLHHGLQHGQILLLQQMTKGLPCHTALHLPLSKGCQPHLAFTWAGTALKGQPQAPAEVLGMS